MWHRKGSVTHVGTAHSDTDYQYDDRESRNSLPSQKQHELSFAKPRGHPSYRRNDIARIAASMAFMDYRSWLCRSLVGGTLSFVHLPVCRFLVLELLPV